MIDVKSLFPNIFQLFTTIFEIKIEPDPVKWIFNRFNGSHHSLHKSSILHSYYYDKPLYLKSNIQL